jgi:hypothetical protein
MGINLSVHHIKCCPSTNIIITFYKIYDFPEFFNWNSHRISLLSLERCNSEANTYLNFQCSTSYLSKGTKLTQSPNFYRFIILLFGGWCIPNRFHLTLSATTNPVLTNSSISSTTNNTTHSITNILLNSLIPQKVIIDIWPSMQNRRNNQCKNLLRR